MSPHLSKTLLNNYRQCPRRLWLELRDRRLQREGGAPVVPVQYSAGTLARFAQGHVVGRIAQAMWPHGLDIEQAARQASGGQRRDLGLARTLTQEAVAQKPALCRPLFEATFEHRGILVQADVLLPVRGGWQMLEVKSSSLRDHPKDHHCADLATQAWVVRESVPLKALGLLLPTKNFELPAPGNYTGFLQLHDNAELQAKVAKHQQAMPATLKAARQVAQLDKEPTKHQPGAQCKQPYECPYQTHCAAPNKPKQRQAVPIRFYSDNGQAKAQQLLDAGYTDLRRVPEKKILQLWNGASAIHGINRRLAQAVRTGQPVIDHEGMRHTMRPWVWPVQHLDFETINFTAPMWPGTRSGQQIPFQYSVHVQAKNGKVQAHHEFLDTSGQDPRRALAQRLLQDLSPDHTILAWNAGFERGVIRALADQFADLAKPLMRLHAQIEDLLPVVRQHYAHPAMAQAETSMFSIKTVLPLLVPGMGYQQLDDVQNGGDAQASYLRVAAPQALRQAQGYTDAERQREIENMRRYCALDTEGMTAILAWLLKNQ